MSQPAAHPRLGQAVRALRAHLELLREEGVTEVEVSPATLAALQAHARTAPAATPLRKPAPAPVRSSPPPARPAPVPATRAPEGPEAEAWSAIGKEIAACKACRLHEKRTHVVPGQGHPRPDIMFVGEGPGADEDEQGLAFVGRAGQLLTQIIQAMGYTRDQVFIGNVVKCRPPDNRTPAPDEMAACLPFLQRQIKLLKPKVIVALGGTAVKGLFNDDKIAITKQRGTWMTYEGIDVMPTFHPAFLLRNPPAKREVWEDMKAVLAKLGRQPPPKK